MCDLFSWEIGVQMSWFLCYCLQVRYVHAVIKRERPGMSVMALYGGINQLRRIDIYREFCRKQHAILFATDVACRGLGECNWERQWSVYLLIYIFCVSCFVIQNELHCWLVKVHDAFWNVFFLLLLLHWAGKSVLSVRFVTLLTRSLPHTIYNTVSVCASCTPNTVMYVTRCPFIIKIQGNKMWGNTANGVSGSGRFSRSGIPSFWSKNSLCSRKRPNEQIIFKMAS